MSDDPEYPTEGNVEFLSEQAFVDVLKDNDAIVALFQPGSVDIRRSKDVTKGDKSEPAYAIDSVPKQSVPETNEYAMTMIIICSSYVDDDKDGQFVQALVTAVRDALHEDSTSQYVDPRGVRHFKGDSKGFLEKLNDTGRDFVFWTVHEQDTTPDDEGRIRRRTMHVDAWGYPGKVK